MKRTVFAVALVLSSGAGHAALITSPADPALAGAAIIDFTGVPTQDAVSFTFGDVTFSTPRGNLRIAPYGEGGSGWLGSGQTLTTRDTIAPSSVVIDFANPVSAFAMDWGAANPSWNVFLYDSGHNLLETLLWVGGNTGGTFSEYFGAAHAGISSVELVSADSGFDWVIIDDFKYVAGAVPEPAAPLLLGLGAAVASLFRRRKRA